MDFISMTVRIVFALILLFGGFTLQYKAQEIFFIERKRAKGLIINSLGFVLLILSLICLI